MAPDDALDKVTNVLGVAGSITTLISLAALALLIAYLLAQHWLSGNRAALKDAISSADNDALARLMGGTNVPLEELSPQDKFNLASEELRVRHRQRVLGYSLVFFSFLALLAFALVIAIFGNETGPAAAVGEPAATAEPEDKLEGLLRQVSLSTPLEAYTSALGAPVSKTESELDPSITKYRFNAGEGRSLQVFVADDRVVAIAGSDVDSQLHIPPLDQCQVERDDGKDCTGSLADFSLSALLSVCQDVTSDVSASGAMFHVGPCYFGASGGYNYYTFVFPVDERMNRPCVTTILSTRDKLLPSQVLGCGVNGANPVGFVVTGDDPEAPPADGASSIADTATLALVDFLNGHPD